MAKALNLAAQRGPEKRAILGTIFLRITNDPIDAGDTRFGAAIDAPASPHRGAPAVIPSDDNDLRIRYWNAHVALPILASRRNRPALRGTPHDFVARCPRPIHRYRLRRTREPVQADLRAHRHGHRRTRTPPRVAARGDRLVEGRRLRRGAAAGQRRRRRRLAAAAVPAADRTGRRRFQSAAGIARAFRVRRGLAERPVPGRSARPGSTALPAASWSAMRGRRPATCRSGRPSRRCRSATAGSC